MYLQHVALVTLLATLGVEGTTQSASTLEKSSSASTLETRSSTPRGSRLAIAATHSASRSSTPLVTRSSTLSETLSATLSTATSTTLAVTSSASSITGRPAEPTNFPATGEWDLSHIKLEVDYQSKACLAVVNDVYQCSGNATIGNHVNGVCEPIWTMGTKLEDGQAISGCKQTGGTIIVDKDPAKLRFRNKYTQEVRWTVEANSPNMNGGKISWNVAVIPQFEANFPHGPNGDQYMVDGELRDTM